MSGGPSIESTIARNTALGRRLNPTIDAALESLWHDERRLGCKHVVRDGDLPVLCIPHPSGLSCLACHQRHVRRHDDKHEFTCDACGDIVKLISPVISTAVSIGMELRDTFGRHRTYYGPVLLSGVGVCDSCKSGGAS